MWTLSPRPLGRLVGLILLQFAMLDGSCYLDSSYLYHQEELSTCDPPLSDKIVDLVVASENSHVFEYIHFSVYRTLNNMTNGEDGRHSTAFLRKISGLYPEHSV